MDTTVWSSPAMCFVPTGETAREHKYVTTAGRVKFQPGQSGRISFVTAVSAPLPDGRYVLRAHLERTTPDLFGTSIILRRASHTSGAVETLLNTVGVEGSLGDPQNNVRFSDSPVKSLDFDLNRFYYWVQVTNERRTPQTNETVDAVLGVTLRLQS